MSLSCIVYAIICKIIKDVELRKPPQRKPFPAGMFLKDTYNLFSISLKILP